MITCDEIIHVMDIVSTKMTDTVARNVSISSRGEKVRDGYILRTALLMIILLLIITVICYHYAITI